MLSSVWTILSARAGYISPDSGFTRMMMACFVPCRLASVIGSRKMWAGDNTLRFKAMLETTQLVALATHVQ